MKFSKLLFVGLLFSICMPSCQQGKNCSHEELLTSLQNMDEDIFKNCTFGKTDLDFQYEEGNTVLMLAAQQGLHDFVEILLNQEINTEIFNKNEKNAIMIAHEIGKNEIETMIKTYQLELWEQKENRYEEKVLLSAIGQDNDLIIEKYVGSGVDFSGKTEDGIVFMAFAIFSGSSSIVKKFLQNDVDANSTFDFRPVLSIAAMFGEAGITQLLLDNGAKVDELDGPGQTALMFAAKSGYIEIVEILLIAGADLSIKDRNGETALDKAVTKNHFEVQKLLDPIESESISLE